MHNSALIAANKQIKQFSKITVLSTLLTLCACNSNIKNLPKISDIPTPDSWETRIGNNDVPTTESLGDVESAWLKNFKDPELDKYVAKAVQNNPNLLNVAAQLKSAIKQVNITGSSLWPTVSTNVHQNRTTVEGQVLSPTSSITDTDGVDDGLDGVNLDGIGGDADDTTDSDETTSFSTQIRTARATLNISWEADIWGRLTQRKKSAAYSAKAQGETFKYARLTLVANTGRGWYNLITSKLQLDLAHQRLKSFQETASLIDSNYKAGLSSALDVYSSRSAVQQEKVALANARFNYIQTARAFKRILGEYPNTDIEFKAVLPELGELPPTGLPSQLLTRRPDIKASQLNYEAQIATAKATRRDLYPRLTFSGSIGDNRDTFQELFEGDNLIRTFLSDLTLPIFASGSLRSLHYQALYSAEAAYANLLTTTLTAFEEVENALSQETLLREQKVATQEGVSLSENALEIALDRYKLGIENYTTVLESQRQLFSSKQNELNIRNALLQNRISLHLALGGGFSDEVDPNPLKSLPTISNLKSSQ